MLPERLAKAWNERRQATAIDAVMRFADEGLVLGAGTVLVPTCGFGRDLSVGPREPRLTVLLTAAHSAKPRDLALRHLRKATECWRAGDDALASMHLVLSHVDRLRQPEADAQRLFLADELLDRGVDADAIMTAAEEGASVLDQLYKYDPDQPRVPAGSGRTSGQWTTGNAGPAADSSSNSLMPSQREVNPSTVTPAGNTKGTYVGLDACFKARTDCQVNYLDAGWQGTANDNIDREGRAACSFWGRACDSFERDVYSPDAKLSFAAVRFNDGGIVVMSEGRLPVYFPREIAVLKFPHWRTPKL